MTSDDAENVRLNSPGEPFVRAKVSGPNMTAETGADCDPEADASARKEDAMASTTRSAKKYIGLSDVMGSVFGMEQAMQDSFSVRKEEVPKEAR